MKVCLYSGVWPEIFFSLFFSFEPKVAFIQTFRKWRLSQEPVLITRRHITSSSNGSNPGQKCLTIIFGKSWFNNIGFFLDQIAPMIASPLGQVINKYTIYSFLKNPNQFEVGVSVCVSVTENSFWGKIPSPLKCAHTFKRIGSDVTLYEDLARCCPRSVWMVMWPSNTHTNTNKFEVF